jgi:pyrroline-5-carboxylate reductase
MGEAIVAGLLRAGLLAPTQIVATTRRHEAAEAVRQRHGVRITTDNLQAIGEADAVLIAVKPQRVSKVLHEEGVRAALVDKPVISIAAGVTLAQLQGWLPESPVIRAMPNTPCLIGQRAASEPATPRSRWRRSCSTPWACASRSRTS